VRSSLRIESPRRAGALAAAAILGAALLTSPLPARAARDAALELFHGPDDTGAMSLKTIRYTLDGKDLLLQAPAVDGDPARPVFTGPLAPGTHKLRVEAGLEGKGSVFTYLSGYKFKMTTILDVEVLEGEGVDIRSRILPQGGITEPWQDRYRLVLTLSAAPRPGGAPDVASAAKEPEPVATVAYGANAATPAPSPASEPAAPPAGATAPAKEIVAVGPKPETEPPAAGSEEPAASATVTATEPAKPAKGSKPAAATAAPSPSPRPVLDEPGAARPARPTVASAEPERPAKPVKPPVAAAEPPAASPSPKPAPRLAAAEPSRRESPAAPPASGGASGCSVAPIHFDFDRSTLTAEAREALDGFAACLQGSAVRVRLEGHCDARGTDEYNRWLAWDRAAAVRAHLVERGVTLGRMRIKYLGKSQPICDEATEACYARNRRVDAEVVP
jgi:peptidoglycan-associated lipoprotein